MSPYELCRLDVAGLSGKMVSLNKLQETTDNLSLTQVLSYLCFNMANDFRFSF